MGFEISSTETQDRPESSTFCLFAGEFISAGLGFRFQARGRSMVPLIQDGDILHVERARVAKLRVGDIVLFEKEKELKAHRIVGKRNQYFTMRGDAGVEGDGEVQGEQIVGKIIAKECRVSGRIISLDSTRERARFFLTCARRWARRTTRHASGNRLLLGAFCLSALTLLTPFVRAQVGIDNSSQFAVLDSTSGSSTIGLTHTVTAGGLNRLLVVGVSMNTTGNTGSTVTGITFNGTAFPASQKFTFEAASMRVEIWYLLQPATGTNLALDVTVNRSGGSKMGVAIGAVDFTGVDQSGPIRGFASNSGASTAPSVTIASASPEIVLSTLATGGNLTVTAGSGETLRWDVSSGGGGGQGVAGFGATATGAASVTMAETLNASNAWSEGAISIRPPEADLSITKTASASTVLQGQPLTYTLTVTNNGPRAAGGVIVTDSLPVADVTYVSSSFTVSSPAGSGTCIFTSPNVICVLGSINNGATATVTINTTAATPSLATNSATVTSSTIDPNLANNTASVTTTIEFPTAIKANGFSANRGPGGVVLSWNTGGELHNLGFNIYRDSGGEKTQMNSSLIAGSALLMRNALEQHGAKTYRWIDKSPDATSLYWLEDVDLNGTRTMHGPISVQAGVATFPAGRSSSTIEDLNTSPPHPNLSSATGSGLAHVREAIARPSLNLANKGIGFQLAAMPAVKIFVDHEDWYHITQPQLVAAGLNPNADANSLRLYAEGVEQPVRIIGGSGKFGPQSAIEFYGTAIDTPFSGQRVYWLVSGGPSGLRIPEISSGSAGSQAQTFTQTLELKPRTTYFAALLREDTDNFFGPLVSPVAESQTLNVSNLAPGEGTLSISLQGVTQGQQHDVTVMLNGSTLGDVTFADQQTGRAAFAVNTGVLTNGTNTITLTSQLGSNDLSLVDTIDVGFPHTFTAESDYLKFTADAGSTVNISGFVQSPSHLIDVTNPLQPFELEHNVTSQNGGYSLQATIPWTTSGQHTLLALSDAQLGAPVSLAPHSPSNLHGVQPGADFVVLTAPQFAAQLQPLAVLHRSEGKSVATVSVDAVYDEFNFGERSPFAIRTFLKTASEAWQNKPHYLELVGDASVDPRNYLGLGFFDFVPTRIVPTAELKTASDDWFSDFNHTGVAQIATGRLPARTAVDAQTMVSKIVGYASTSSAGWANQALLAADRDDPSVSFTHSSQAVQKLLPPGMNVTDVFTTALGIPTAKQNLLAGLNSGQLLVNYNGHGSVEIWSGSDLFDDTAASSLTNGSKLPMFVIMNCLNGFFQDVYTQSLAESLMLAPNGGAVAVWASSGLTQPDPQFVMNQKLIQGLFSQAAPAIGDAVLSAKSAITDQDVRKTFILFGDPAMHLHTISPAGAGANLTAPSSGPKPTGTHLAPKTLREQDSR